MAYASGMKIKYEMELAKASDNKVVVISSPFIRCLQTSQEVCKALGVNEIIVDSTIGEILHQFYYKKFPLDSITIRSPELLAQHFDTSIKLTEKVDYNKFKKYYPEDWDVSDRYVPFMNELMATEFSGEV